MRVREVRIRPHVRDGIPTGRWVVDIPPGFTTTGKRERPLVDDELSARRMKASVEGSKVPVETTSRAPVITAPQLVTFWCEDEMAKVRSGKKKASSLETNLHQLEPVAAYLGSLDLKNLTARHLQDYQGHRRAQGMQPETINSEMGTFVQVEKWAVEAGWLEKVVTTTRVPVPPKRPDVLTEEEYLRLMEALPERLRPLIRFLAETGCRWGEAAQMLWLNIDLDAGWAEVARQGEWSPKTAYSLRTLYLSPDLVTAQRKPGGGYRPIFRFGWSEQARYRLFKSALEPFAGFHASQFQFAVNRRDRGSQAACKAVLEALNGISGMATPTSPTHAVEDYVFLELDVENFFGSIGEEWWGTKPVLDGRLKEVLYTDYLKVIASRKVRDRLGSGLIARTGR